MNSRYYDPQIGRFINADDISILSEGKDLFNGLNLYAYCGNNPVNNTDESGNAWWDWLISALQIVVGVVLVVTGVGAGFGASLVIGGAIGLISNAFGSSIGGGIGSMLNGSGAISTGISLFSYGWIGTILGTIVTAIGVGTMIFGANEIAYGITGNNYIQQWTGMSDSSYAGLYLGLNIGSSIGTIAGRLGMRVASTKTIGRNGVLKGSGQKPYSRITRGRNVYFFNGKGNAYWAIHDIGLNSQHWHTSLGRDNRHIYSYLEFLLRFIFKKW